MTLEPKALAVIAEGPQLVDGAFVKLADGRMLQSREPEPLEVFARRVALIAVEEERERAILEHDQSACAAEIADLKRRLEVAHAEGFADGARAQREMEPTFEMGAVLCARLPLKHAMTASQTSEVLKSVAAVAPLVGGEEGGEVK